MDKKILEQIKNKLLSDKENIEGQLASIASKNTHNEDDYNARFPEYGDESGENANEIADFNDNLALERNLEKILVDINKALLNIKKNNYGKCKYCGKEIATNRLLARPVSSSCVRCKEKLTGVK
ncbi:MAG: TraR/DksA C4-type zinc finger protein [bacterium]